MRSVLPFASKQTKPPTELHFQAMAASPTSVLSYLVFSALLLFSSLPACHCAQQAHGGGDGHTHHLVAVRTLLPRDVCSPYKGSNHTGLKVVHRHGPCSHAHGGGGPAKPSPAQALLLDESRADSIRRLRRSPAAQPDARGPRGSMASTIPARLGTALGTANYVVTVGFGTPRKDLSVAFDTGSDLTWIQCQPCVAYCYPQQEPVFDPARSSTYRNISCSSPDCAAVRSATGLEPGCSASNCLYAIQYGDNSYSVGFFARETLSLTPTDVFQSYRFGCGEKNSGLFGRASGLLGLGRDAASLVSQASEKYGKVFSYCLPSTSSSTGYLTMGSGATRGIRFTPMLSESSMASLYFLDMVGISVGDRQLAVSASVFQTPGTVIDSGTVITRLPPAAYAALRSAFRQFMTKYPSAPVLSILDTCYDFSSYDTVGIPKVALLFRGGVVLDVDSSGIMYAASPTQVCLAFAGNSDPNDVGIIGNTQQKTYKVVYDVSRAAIGFGTRGCS